ncbi:5986_t:CDS:2, partial [Racocetra fulgida]
MEADPKNPFVVSGTPIETDENNSSYHPSSDEQDDDSLIEVNIKNNYSLNWFTGPGVIKSSLSEDAKKVIEPELLNMIFDTIKNEFASHRLSDNDVLRCHKVAEIASESFEKCKLLLRKWQRDLDDNQEDLILETFESMSTDVLEASAYRKRKFDPCYKDERQIFPY